MTATADPGKLWRATHGIPIVAAFDGYRALSIAGVVVFHIFTVCGLLAVAGDSAAGVLIWGVLPIAPLTALFIVSGFVLFLPTAVRSGDFGGIGAFAIRRAARLLPAYWLSLLVALVLVATLAAPDGTPQAVPSLGSILAHLSMLQTPALLVDGPVNVDGVPAGGFLLGLGVIPPVWTLSVEIAFCFVLPLVATAYYRRPFVGLAVAAACLVGWRELALNADGVAGAFGIDLAPATEARFGDYYASQLPAWGLGFAAGMTGAWLYVRLRARIPADLLARRASWALLAAVPALALVVYLTGQDAVDDPNPLMGLFARQSIAISLSYPLLLGTVMLAISLAPSGVQRPFANQPLRRIADVSYGVYLIHFAVIWFALSQLSLPRSGSVGSVAAWSALVFPVSFAYAYLSARFLERPVRRWARKVSRSGGRPAYPATAPAATVARRDAPPVSVVIPTHDRRELLGDAIDSVLAQDYPNLELLVVDDGSTDGTPELLAAYAGRHPEERFRFLRQDNAGQARALNRGNEQARGEILGYLSDDDLLAPELVSRLAAELIADPGAAVAYPGYHVINGSGGVEDTVLPIPYSPVEALRLHDTVIGPGGLARRWALESAGGWDPSLRWMGDLILWMGIGVAGRAVRVAEPLASWRHHPGSVTLRLSLDHAREHLTIVRHGIDFAGLPALSRSDRAEALRNACLTAALFAGGGETWPGDRYVTFDLHRKRISAWSSGQADLGAIDEVAAADAADRYRELVLLTVEHAERRAPLAAQAGFDAALRRLRAVGAVPGADGSFADGVDERELRLGLVEAAVACGAEIELRSSRFVILDRQRTQVPDGELEETVSLGYQASAEQLGEAIKRGRSPGRAGASPSHRPAP